MLRAVGRALRDTASAMSRLGLSLEGEAAVVDKVSRHRRMMAVNEVAPTAGNNSFVAPSAAVIGAVEVGDAASVWYNAVVRGDAGKVTIGKGSSIGHNAVVGNFGHSDADVVIGESVVVGPGAVVNAATLHDECAIGAGATVGAGAIVETHAVVADGATVPANAVVRKGEYWEGNPATMARQLSQAERAAIATSASSLHAATAAHHAEHDKTPAQREEEKLRAMTEAGVDAEPEPLY
ncbi:transcription factor APFI [Thecamonas trahens ATCC 50062]|uniref:Transcription factor APFI n=1 Tax=Thecamonas trahens ATCC 50062 TaxID=461836 RepID=A0A0L0DG79_THETB|nr:transcription factor APFI [Thecamonas trahens ATCC 50062]KNC51121.1 transcription factor APFI [Thecamonas trahens ATCC 50062]|eukprot:XP_013756329.1 transcription factor APFI [Thecamonas trahens ATCC 50062]